MPQRVLLGMGVFPYSLLSVKPLGVIMETYTIQIQTSHLSEEFAQEDYEFVALEMLLNVDTYIEEQGLTPYLSIQATWMKGCIIENIVLKFHDLDMTAKALTVAGTYILLKDYSDISASIAKLVSHIRKIVVVIGKVSVRVVRVVVNKGESPALIHKIDPNFDSIYVEGENSDDE